MVGSFSRFDDDRLLISNCQIVGFRLWRIVVCSCENAKGIGRRQRAPRAAERTASYENHQTSSQYCHSVGMLHRQRLHYSFIMEMIIRLSLLYYYIMDMFWTLPLWFSFNWMQIRSLLSWNTSTEVYCRPFWGNRGLNTITATCTEPAVIWVHATSHRSLIKLQEPWTTSRTKMYVASMKIVIMIDTVHSNRECIMFDLWSDVI